MASLAALVRRGTPLAQCLRSASGGTRVLALAVIVGAWLAACSSPMTPSASSAAPSSPISSAAPASQAPASQAAAPTPTPSPGQSSATGQAGGFDACALLSLADIAKIVGGKVQAGRAMPSGGWVAGQCAWNTAATGFEISVGTAASIKAFGDVTAPDAKAKFAGFAELAKRTGDTAKPVAGIGDGALLATSGMAAYAGDTYLEVLNLGLTTDQLVQIVKLAVANL